MSRLKRRFYNSKLNRNSGSVLLILDSLIGGNKSEVLILILDTDSCFWLTNVHDAFNLLKCKFKLDANLDCYLLQS